MEWDILITAGQTPRPASDIQPVMMNTVFIDAAPEGICPQAMPESGVSGGNVNIPEEVKVPASKAAVHAQILQDIAANKDVSSVLRTIWCKPFTAKLVDFVKDNVNIALQIIKSEYIKLLSAQSTGGKNYIRFSKLSHEKPNLYAFLNKHAEFEDDKVLACEQYLLGFITTDLPLAEQSIIV